MQTTLDSATDYFQRLVDAKVFANIDECWENFADYLAHRTEGLPAGMVGFFHGAIYHDLMNVIYRWLEKRPSRLLDPQTDDVDAEYFREFDHKEEVIKEAKGFVEAEGHSHLFDN